MRSRVGRRSSRRADKVLIVPTAETDPPFPELLHDTPDVDGSFEPSRTRTAIKNDIEAAQRRDWIAEHFGSGKAAAFLRRAQQDRLTPVQALRELRKEMGKFQDTRELQAVANELMRSEHSGSIVAEALTLRALRKHFRPR